MTEAEHAARLTRMEAYVRRLTFLCPPECRAGFYAHAETVMAYLAEVIDADAFGLPRPAPPATAHLSADIARHLSHLEHTWQR